MQKKCEMDSGSQNSRNDGFSKTLEKKIQRKQKRLQHMISKETGIECYDIPKKVQFTTNIAPKWFQSDQINLTNLYFSHIGNYKTTVA